VRFPLRPRAVHRAFAAALDLALDKIHAIKAGAEPRWPMIVLRTPKGWTGPKEVDGVPIEGTFRAHQVPLTDVKKNGAQLAMLEQWMRSYRPGELFPDGQLRDDLRTLPPVGAARMSANPQTNGGAVPLEVPPYERYAIEVAAPGRVRHESTRAFGELLRDVYRANPTAFRLMCPDETMSNRLGAVFEAEDRAFAGTVLPIDENVSHHGRVMEVLSEHNCQGWLEGYVLTGRHGVFATYEAFALIVASMASQHAKWLEMTAALPWRQPPPSLNYLLTSTCWRNDHNGFSHQGPGFMDTLLTKKGAITRIYLPPDANCLLSTADHCLRSRNYVNLIIQDKQPQLQWLSLADANAHCARGASVWAWASTAVDDPDIVLGCAGDIPTLGTLAAAKWLREHAPELRVRVVNVVDLMKLFHPKEHPHGMSQEQFVELFTEDVDVCFSFHGYAGAVHLLIHARPHPVRFHVRGYKEEGTTTTPFDMVVLNETSRFHLAIDAIRRAKRPLANADQLVQLCEDELRKHHDYVATHFEDRPEIRDWTW